MSNPGECQSVAVAGLFREGKQNIHDRFAQRAQAERYRDRFKKGWRRTTHRNEVEAVDRLLAGLGPIKTTMDVACGPGRFAEVLAKHSDRVLQTDFSFQMLNLSREDHPLGTRQTEYFQADARALPVGDNVADLIFCHRFLNHIPDSVDRGNMMRELARVSGRYVVVSCLGPPRIIRLIRQGVAFLKGQSSVKKDVDVSDLVESAEAAGLVLQKQTPIHSWIKSAVFLTFIKKSLNSANGILAVIMGFLLDNADTCISFLM